MKIKIIITALIIIFVFSLSCTNDNAEDQTISTCDSTNVVYADIQSIFETNCNSCHNANQPSAGINTEDYENLKNAVNTGRLIGAINHLDGFSEMPQGRPEKLPECDLGKINNWVNNNMPE